MEGDGEQLDDFNDTFIETPAILDKYKGAAGIVNGKYQKKATHKTLNKM